MPVIFRCSTNPKRLGYKDKTKGKLFFEMCRILRDKQPSVFVAENVKGLLSANKGEAFPLIIKEFEKSGYHIKYKVLNAADYGVPQKRQRVFIVGFKDKKAYDNFDFPEPTTEKNQVPLKRILEDGRKSAMQCRSSGHDVACDEEYYESPSRIVCRY